MSHLYERKIKKMGNAGRNGGEYYTPRSLIKTIVKVVSPKNIVIYQNGEIEMNVTVDNDTVWLVAEDIAKLFDVQRPAIVKYIGNIYKTNELSRASTCSILEQVAKDGKKRKKNFYNLDMIISVCYRVNSIRVTQFRIWATTVRKAVCAFFAHSTQHCYIIGKIEV